MHLPLNRRVLATCCKPSEPGISVGLRAILCIVFAGMLLIPSNFAEAKFDVIWNVPSFLCSINFGLNLTQNLLKYNIPVNNKETFIGDKVALLYEATIGKYPKIDPKKGDINGGVPQLEKLKEHLEKAEADILKIIPNPDFNGLGVIDWEAWRPIWEFLWGSLEIYRIRTLEYLKNLPISTNNGSIGERAKTLWEYTAKEWMLENLKLAKKLRPKGKWGYYLFPDCYNYEGKNQPSEFSCSANVQGHNNRLSWLWKESTALYPSIYFQQGQVNYNDSQRTWFIHAKLAEAVRVSLPHHEIYPYINYLLPVLQTQVPKDHFWKMLAVIASMGMDGAVIWGSSGYFSKKTDCQDLKEYIDDIIGPAVTAIVSNVNRCDKIVCNGNGRCTWPEEPYSSWKYLADTSFPDFNSKKIVCKCKTGKGRYCD